MAMGSAAEGSANAMPQVGTWDFSGGGALLEMRCSQAAWRSTGGGQVLVPTGLNWSLVILARTRNCCQPLT